MATAASPTAPRRRRRVAALLWAGFAVVGGLRLLFPPEPGYLTLPFQDLVEERPRERRRRERPPTPVHPPASAVPADLWRLEIEIAPRGVATLRSYQWSGWGGEQQERPEVLATVREGGVTYTNVALHLKGSAGSFRPFDDKPALTLSFSKHAKGQAFHGCPKISLNNSVQDPTYLSEVVCRELFEAAGVPVPRADHATVVINGRDLGLYVLTEGWGKPFLRRYFKNVSGNLYDGGFVQDITAGLETNSGDHPDDRSDLEQLADAALDPDPARRWQRLNEVLDVDRFTTFLALEVMTCHWDGYGMHHNNYRVFHDRDRGRMVFLPHGLDQMFGVFRSSPNSPILPGMEGLVAQGLLATREGRRLYLDRVGTLRTNLFLEDRLTNRVQELARRIRPTLAAYAPERAEEHDGQVAYLSERIVERARSISEQLASPPEPITFATDGTARPAGWKPRVSTENRAAVRFGRAETDARRELRIAVGPEGGGGTWRARSLLEAGRYRFEGRARTAGLQGQGGVCLRLSGMRTGWTAGNDGEWLDLAIFFDVHEPLAEVELVCELVGTDAEAWFDESSLRLVRE